MSIISIFTIIIIMNYDYYEYDIKLYYNYYM